MYDDRQYVYKESKTFNFGMDDLFQEKETRTRMDPKPNENIRAIQVLPRLASADTPALYYESEVSEELCPLMSSRHPVDDLHGLGNTIPSMIPKG